MEERTLELGGTAGGRRAVGDGAVVCGWRAGPLQKCPWLKG